MFLGREPLKSELEDIKLYVVYEEELEDNKNIKKLTEKVLSLTQQAPLVKPKQLSEKEIQALETQKRRQQRIQRRKDKVEARNIGPKIDTL